MLTTTKKSKQKKQATDELRIKAKLFDEVLALIEEKYLGELMRKTEKEANVSLAKAKKLLA
jgi:hypothetical protein